MHYTKQQAISDAVNTVDGMTCDSGAYTTSGDDVTVTYYITCKTDKVPELHFMRWVITNDKTIDVEFRNNLAGIIAVTETMHITDKTDLTDPKSMGIYINALVDQLAATFVKDE